MEMGEDLARYFCVVFHHHFDMGVKNE